MKASDLPVVEAFFPGKTPSSHPMAAPSRKLPKASPPASLQTMMTPGNTMVRAMDHRPSRAHAIRDGDTHAVSQDDLAEKRLS